MRLVLVALFWGGTFIAGRVAAQAVPPMTAAALRFAIAVPLLAVIVWKSEGGLPALNRSQLLVTFVLGLTGIFLYNICFFAALSRISAGRTALFVALNPIITSMLLAAFLGERIGAVRWIGISIALIGAWCVISGGNIAGAWTDIAAAFGTGELLMFCAISSWAAYTILGRVALKTLSPVAATSYAAIWGLLLLACGAIAELGRIEWSSLDWRVYAALTYLGVFGTVISFIWYYQGVKIIGPARTAVFNNLVPVFGVFLAWILLAEPVLFSMVVGGLLVVGGLTFTNYKR
ncbi:MAG TPA: DMT family transporter [Noviherbaspirillum sp.]|nr:DMT family transporter [Noviherbaspirillum sp.]